MLWKPQDPEKKVLPLMICDFVSVSQCERLTQSRACLAYGKSKKPGYPDPSPIECSGSRHLTPILRGETPETARYKSSRERTYRIRRTLEVVFDHLSGKSNQTELKCHERAWL
ncbi:hypothetical protein TNCV_209791 [Trichonephila clavipes]|uniref:Uncharacterized protein n=1 Tax=Trichonephila clavipes TaxID=2585209 RepID=A0A8X6VIU7_TRICX|nr:hypothetical protein TNCV_209791 [Trichonephila clavipes]